MREKFLLIADRIWHLLLISICLDLVTLDKHIFAFASDSTSAVVVTVLLCLSAITNSEKAIPAALTFIKSFQEKMQSSKNYKYSILLYSTIVLAIFAKLFLAFGLLTNINIYTVAIAILVFAISVKHILQEKQKHDLLLEHNLTYYQKNEFLQNLILSLLPAASARIAGVLAAQSIHAHGYHSIATLQYCLAVLLLLEAFPKKLNILHKKGNDSQKSFEYRADCSYP